MIISAPASTANLGAGFDVLGMALDLPFEVWLADDDGEVAPEGFLLAEPTHPVALAYRDAGGVGDLWWRSPIPPGRGLGFSGAATVAGAFAACEDVDEAVAVATLIEGHPDNAAPSGYGGFCVSAAGATVRLDPPDGVELVVWWPTSSTSTRKARAALPATVPFGDAVENVGRSSLLVAAVAAGRLDLWDEATRDRLHQDVRLSLAPGSAAVIERCRAAGSLAVWLSGSGPTVAALCRRGTTDPVVAAIGAEGSCRVVTPARRGVSITKSDQSGQD